MQANLDKRRAEGSDHGSAGGKRHRCTVTPATMGWTLRCLRTASQRHRGSGCRPTMMRCVSPTRFAPPWKNGMQNLSELTRRLVEAQVEFVLIGGFAAVTHGVTLVTRDVDICCRFSEANLRRIQKAFADVHPVHRSRPDLPLALTPEQCAGLKNLYLKTDLGIVDCLGEVLGVGDFESALEHSVELELPFGNCRVLRLRGAGPRQGSNESRPRSDRRPTTERDPETAAAEVRPRELGGPGWSSSVRGHHLCWISGENLRGATCG